MSKFVLNGVFFKRAAEGSSANYSVKQDDCTFVPTTQKYKEDVTASNYDFDAGRDYFVVIRSERYAKNASAYQASSSGTSVQIDLHCVKGKEVGKLLAPEQEKWSGGYSRTSKGLVKAWLMGTEESGVKQWS